MSVSTYLSNRASNAVLSADERSSIATSISTLGTRIGSWFGVGVSTHFRFGSSTRDTILPRSMDALSDIDYIVVFAESGYKPQTYLDRLKKFAEAKYSTSELFQSSPTMVLKLNHIRFELVPALSVWGSTYNIPKGPNDWQSTNPNDFNKALSDKNAEEKYLLKPAIRLLKFWNANSGYVFDSYLLEKWASERFFWGCSSVRDYLFFLVDALSIDTDVQWRKDQLARAKKIVTDTKTYEAGGYPALAEAEVKKLIPE
ncbi:MAG: hypothetical protein Q8S03_14070 [Brevundimonas sp.]|uniref:SMODS domain-containing nucleotidyltransferase n=1 Tax=Brevundimonas sp. TaxID=1871086 RepID=UPI002734EDAE|nr:hypothetical protein [Brevundimonas sp.]MDP3405817.1 hypothetical protein [Brevundimonas sp.]